MRVKIESDIVQMQADIPEKNILRLAELLLKYAGANLPDQGSNRAGNDEDRKEDDGVVVYLPDEKMEEPKEEEPVRRPQPERPYVPVMPAFRRGGTFKEPERMRNESPAQQPGYRGFLHIKCATCGEVKSFCTKGYLTQFKCSEGHVTELRDLTKMHVNCKCGKVNRYFTNMKESPFVFECFTCGAPVDMVYHDKKGIFVAMGGPDV